MRANILIQAMTILKISFKKLHIQLGRFFSTIVGTFGVISVLITLLAIVNGYEKVVALTSHEDNVLILMQGATSELASVISADSVSELRNNKYIDRNDNGEPIFSPEVFTTVKVKNHMRQAQMNGSLRRVEKMAYEIRPELVVYKGRNFISGRRELIIGKRLTEQYSDLEIGSDLIVNGKSWHIVGYFKANGSIAESEIWGDVTTLQDINMKGNSFQVIYTKLVQSARLTDLKDDLEGNPGTKFRIITEEEYYTGQSDSMNQFVKTLAYGIGSLMMIGVIFASMSTNYSNINARIHDLMVCKILGFRDEAIFLSLVIESVIMTSLGAGIGVTLIYVLYNDYSASTLFFSHNYSQVLFSFDVSIQSLFLAFFVAVIIGIAGSYLPARRVSRGLLVQVISRRN